MDRKRDVYLLFFVTNTTPCADTTNAQSTNPRFMYANHEVMKRSNAISV
jgi:hypothetical protein